MICSATLKDTNTCGFSSNLNIKINFVGHFSQISGALLHLQKPHFSLSVSLSPSL